MTSTPRRALGLRLALTAFLAAPLVGGVGPAHADDSTERCFCDSGAWTRVFPDVQTINLSAGQSLCIRQGAEFSQSLNVPAGASVCVETGDVSVIP